VESEFVAEKPGMTGKVGPMVTEARDKSEVTQPVRERNDTGLKLDLLRFLGRCPHTKFDWRIIARGLGWTRRSNIAEALESLVKIELIEKHTRQGLHFYSLTTDTKKQQRLLSL